MVIERGGRVGGRWHACHQRAAERLTTRGHRRHGVVELESELSARCIRAGPSTVDSTKRPVSLEGVPWVERHVLAELLVVLLPNDLLVQVQPGDNRCGAGPLHCRVLDRVQARVGALLLHQELEAHLFHSQAALHRLAQVVGTAVGRLERSLVFGVQRGVAGKGARAHGVLHSQRCQHLVRPRPKAVRGRAVVVGRQRRRNVARLLDFQHGVELLEMPRLGRQNVGDEPACSPPDTTGYVSTTAGARRTGARRTRHLPGPSRPMFTEVVALMRST